MTSPQYLAIALLVLPVSSCQSNPARADPAAAAGSSSAQILRAASEEPQIPASSAPANSVLVADASSPDSSATIPTEPCPPEMELVGRSCVDKWEAHLVVVGADGTTTEHAHFERPKSGESYKAISSKGMFPQGYISRPEAQSACENAGKRLCTLGEWYRACQGPRGLRFPYGMNETAGKCNSRKAHLLSKLFGNSPGAWKYDDFNNPILNQQEGYLARSGQYEECASGSHVFDMVGNLHEWISDTVDDSLPKKIPLDDGISKRVPFLHGHGIFMGGFYSTGKEHGQGCGFITIGHEPSYHDYSTGFRCCKRAQLPASPEKKKK